MNCIGPIARMPARDAFPVHARWEYRHASPETLEAVLQRLPPDARETFTMLRRMQQEILTWRASVGNRKRAS